MLNPAAKSIITNDAGRTYGLNGNASRFLLPPLKQLLFLIKILHFPMAV